MAERGYLGEFELMVMLAVMRQGEEPYGVPIWRELEQHAGREVTLGSVYAALERLAEKGLVHSRLGEPTRERGGKAKRYFFATPKGLAKVRETRQVLTRLWHGLPGVKGAEA